MILELGEIESAEGRHKVYKEAYLIKKHAQAAYEKLTA